MRKLVFVVALLFPLQALATVPEIPGDGIDNGTSSGTAGSCPAGYADAVYSTGCDLLLPEPDKDGDGYTSDGSLGAMGTTSIDCDDTNRTIYPGVHRKGACTGSDYQTCQTDGTWNSCQTGPLCEKTGSGSCYYVDCGSGSNANAGTYAAPFLTLGKVSGGSGGSPPASPVTLVAGDAVYVIGTTACTTTFNANIGGYSVPVLFEGSASGTSSDKIIVRRYPGSTALMTVTNGSAFYLTGDYYKIAGFKGSTTYSSSIKTGFVVGSYADNIEVENNFITSAAGHGDYNHGGIYLGHSSNSNIHHNYVGDVTVSTGTLENGGGIFWLDDQDLGEGANHLAQFNTVYYTNFSDAVNGACWKFKHGVDLDDTGVNGHRVRYSTCVNARRVFSSSSSGLRAFRIFAYNDGSGYDGGSSVQSIARIINDGENAPHEDNRIEQSTFVNMSMMNWAEPSYLSAAEKITFANNIVIDNDAAYGAGNNEGIISIDGYGSNTQHGTLLSQGSLAINNNCYYNASAALNFNYFGQDSGGHGPAGNLGDDYTFASWKTATSQDANSYNENPNVDTYYRATATNCADKGFLLTSEEGVTSTSALTPPAVFESKRRKKK